MNNLTRYWRRKRRAITALLAAPNDPPPPLPPDPTSRATITTWFKALTSDLTVPPFPWDPPVPPPPNRTPEDAVDEALKELKKWHGKITDALVGGAPNPNRRSARLARMVQAAINVSPDGGGFYASVADATPGNVNDYSEYRETVRVASSCAARFLDRAKNLGAFGGPGAIADALEALAGANRPPAAPPHLPDAVLEEIDELVAAIRKSEARGGLGEGSAYWPSTWVSSSSSTSGP